MYFLPHSRQNIIALLLFYELSSLFSLLPSLFESEAIHKSCQALIKKINFMFVNKWQNCEVYIGFYIAITIAMYGSNLIWLFNWVFFKTF